jgi:CheY-like chemotaxis protein
MSEPTFTILILEDSSVLVAQLSQAFRQQLPGVRVLTARTVAEGQVLIAEYPIDLFILDIHLPDGSGIDFLCDIQTTTPDSKVIMMTAVPLPEYKEKAEGLGVIRFFEKPVNPNAICTLAQVYRDKAAALKNPLLVATPSPSTVPVPTADAFTGALSSLTMVDIIQLKCLGRATQAIDFIRPDKPKGRIYFRLGEIIHAETDHFYGVDAFNEIVSWRGGKLQEVPAAEEPTRSIQTDWQSLLLAAVQRMDEMNLPA